jgi:predicted alpha/beta hydrolase family esterase
MPSTVQPIVLHVPGLGDSGAEHWQSHWEREAPHGLHYRRIVQRDWDHPTRDEWVETLERAVASVEGPAVLAAHSLGCTTVAHWAAASDPAVRARVRGALLVAPSDCEAPSYPAEIEGFAPMPRARLPFPSIVVASSDDPYVTLVRAQEFADAWGGRLVCVGAHGHLNSDSGLGVWPEGHALLRELLAEGAGSR